MRVLITTKKGSDKGTDINFKASYGVSSRAFENYERMGAKDFIETMYWTYRQGEIDGGAPIDQAGLYGLQEMAAGKTKIFGENEEYNPYNYNVWVTDNEDNPQLDQMLIDPATGNVEFLNKIDIGNETSFEIPTEAGKVSAVFVKQSTSGMFWTSEEVDEATRNAVIECLKDNNPSYKGYNAFTFGAGSFELEFKSGRFATYTFTGVKEGDYVKPEEAPEVEIPEVETPEEEVTDKEAQKAANKAEKEAKKAAKKSK